MSRGGSRGGFGGARGGGGESEPLEKRIQHDNQIRQGFSRGGGRGGFQQRDMGPPDTVLGADTPIYHWQDL